MSLPLLNGGKVPESKRTTYTAEEREAHKLHKQKNTIRTWALVVLSVTSVFVMAMSVWYTFILSSKEWCTTAIGATKYANGRPERAITGCFDLLTAQLSAVATNSLITTGTLALCLSVLVIIVLAGGKVSFKGSKDGVETNIGADPNALAAGARMATEAAGEVADELKDTAEK